ncbi:hypothetical protein PISL3812_08750 [Talaromyces islandicus]|uniref:tyrosinase n=1 Tax=Talaromyces islandicus TaxID=28573 RepID=A0A0U1M7Z5_TALIS|nr:hypothetical protein PISL3812_08750 [Talaromyces islandicus]
MKASLLLLISLSALSKSAVGYAITGVSGGVNSETGERPARLDMRSLQSAGPAFDLFVQALSQFQSDDQSDLISYYEVAGIHGYPYRSWDNVEGTYQTGYCTHGSVIFPTWHRPYLALFEQRIWSYAQDIAKSYPDSQRQSYVDAAKTLRIPYWDWAVNPNLPESTTYQKITVNTPTGQQSFDNPLYSYKFHPLPVGTDIPSNDPLAKYTETVRSPDPSTGQSRIDNVNSGMSSNSAWLKSSTYQLLSSEKNYTVFSNNVLQDRGANYNNLEAIHDGVHALVGDGGHMTYFSMAAFDPIFWMHHASIDRIFALWEVLNPDSFIQPMGDKYGTFVLQAGAIEDVNTPLYPFHRSNNSDDFWTSETSRSTKAFGYTYPEIKDWGVDQTALQNNVRTAVNNLYNAPARKVSTGKSKRVNEPTSRAVLRTMTGTDFDSLAVNNLPRHWAINIAVDKYALDGKPFQIHFFYGQPDKDVQPSDYFHADNLIGTYRIFTGPNITMSRGNPSSVTSSSADGDEEQHLSAGQISLSPVLAQAFANGLLPDDAFEPEDVVPTLSERLNWRITDDAGEEVPVQTLTDKGKLRVAVVSRDVEPILEGEEHLFPRYGEWNHWQHATMGKLGAV